MRLSIKRPLLASAAVAVTVLAACASSPAAKNDMSFFVTSKNGGNGANLGGLAGADRLCQSLASAAGAGSRTWRAYLSAQATTDGAAAVNARDRIGRGRGAMRTASSSRTTSPSCTARTTSPSRPR
jgi:hypothetical protein